LTDRCKVFRWPPFPVFVGEGAEVAPFKNPTPQGGVAVFVARSARPACCRPIESQTSSLFRRKTSSPSKRAYIDYHKVTHPPCSATVVQGEIGEQYGIHLQTRSLCWNCLTDGSSNSE